MLGALRSIITARTTILPIVRSSVMSLSSFSKYNNLEINHAPIDGRIIDPSVIDIATLDEWHNHYYDYLTRLLDTPEEERDCFIRNNSFPLSYYQFKNIVAYYNLQDQLASNILFALKVLDIEAGNFSTDNNHGDLGGAIDSMHDDYPDRT